VARDLVPGQPQHPIARGLQSGLLVGVVAAGKRGAVVAVSFDLDDEQSVREEEVDLDALDLFVALRARQPIATKQGQRAVLELASSGGRALDDDGRRVVAARRPGDRATWASRRGE
jgi:hypothetical protein